MSEKHWHTVVIAAAMMLATTDFATGEETLAVRVLPLRPMAPSDVIVQAFVERDERNREIKFVVDSDGYYASSTATLDGGRAPRTREVRFRRMPRGEYRIYVTLIGNDGERANFFYELELH